MKKILLLAVMAVAAVSASAQITWNAKGGVGFATCWGDAEDIGSHFVGKIGAGIEKPISSNWSIMPSLEVAWKGAKETFKEDKETYKGQLDIFYLQIPVLAAYRINLSDNWNTTLKVGPYVACALTGHMKEKYESNYTGVEKDKINIFKDEDGDGAIAQRFDAGIDVGVDFEYHRFVFGVEYELGFVSITKSDYGTLRNGAFYATVGWKF